MYRLLLPNQLVDPNSQTRDIGIMMNDNIFGQRIQYIINIYVVIIIINSGHSDNVLKIEMHYKNQLSPESSL